MEDDDHDELLDYSDDESASDYEDCTIIDKHLNKKCEIYINHTKFEFLITKFLLILSTCGLLILLPIYLEIINLKSDAYTMILSTSTISTICFIFIIIIMKKFSTKYKNINIFCLPIKFYKLFLLSFCYFISGFMIIYATDQKKVLCHLQDPIKGMILVCSLLYYFFFCKKFMGLQRIFSATAIIVGLFIAVDYGLCDEYRCRGYDREKHSDDNGNWNWKSHFIWTIIYMAGLALFAFYYTLFEIYLLTDDKESISNQVTSSFLSTVSVSVSFPNNNDLIISRQNIENSHFLRKYSPLLLSMWIHIIGWFIVVLLFWTDFLPEVGKGTTKLIFLNSTINGVWCHFKLNECGDLFNYSWIFFLIYIIFTISSIRFLIMTQSSVYTISTMSAALPLIGIFWSLLHFIPSENGILLLVWAPSITGELICSLLGLPIIILGLCLLNKSHFQTNIKNNNCNRLVTSSNFT